ncbi:MAG: metal ABC transporter substrate-binding protein [Nitrospirota bacterium]
MHEKKIKVVTSLFPLYDFAKNVGKEKADVTLLLPPGMEPHSFEPKPGDIITLSEADVFVYTGKYMEPWVEDMLKGIPNKNLLVIDASKGVALIDEHMHDADERRHHADEYGRDPHIWLDFTNAQTMVENILQGFVAGDPANKDYYLRNAASYTKQLAQLDRKYRNALASCKQNTLIHGGHFAFGYLARRYGLNYISAYQSFSPNAEPTPQNLIELINKLKSNNLHFLFYEELVMPRVAETIAKETGAGMLKLHGAHNVTKAELEEGVTFISLMEQNLVNLKKGLECQ